MKLLAAKQQQPDANIRRREKRRNANKESSCGLKKI
jgi:hypothetical protein